jgi:hypothetical protein
MPHLQSGKQSTYEVGEDELFFEQDHAGDLVIDRRNPDRAAFLPRYDSHISILRARTWQMPALCSLPFVILQDP